MCLIAARHLLAGERCHSGVENFDVFYLKVMQPDARKFKCTINFFEETHSQIFSGTWDRERGTSARKSCGKLGAQRVSGKPTANRFHRHLAAEKWSRKNGTGPLS